MRTVSFLLALTAIIFSACKTNPTTDNNPTTGTLELVFKAKYNNSPLMLFQNTSTGLSDPSELYFKRLDFFVSNIQGTNSDGSQADFKDVGYISMATSLDQTSSEAGTTFTIDKLPIGSYTNLNIGFGLSDAVNNTTPGSHEQTSPLSLLANYWASWNSYIFCKIEGNVTHGGGTSSFLYHAGVNGMHQLRSYSKNFDIAAGQTTQIVFHINAEDFFFKTNHTIDLVNENSTHSGTAGSAEYNLAQRALTNLADAVVVQ